MKESFWGVFVICFAIFVLIVITINQSGTQADQHNYYIMKEATEGAMMDSFDIQQYRLRGVIRIDKEKFVENFTRRLAQSGEVTRDYDVEFYQLSEEPPKVSIRIRSKASGIALGQFDVENTISAILEEKERGE